jgi:ketosteroid isomerase-like protein
MPERGAHLKELTMTARLTVALTIVLGALTITSTSSYGSDSADQAAVRQLYATWRTAVAEADIPTYVSLLDADVKLMPPGAADIHGASTYEGFLQPVFEAATYRIETVAPHDIEVVGDFAFARYDYIVHLSLKNPDQGVTEPGALTASRSAIKYFDVLRRQQDGGWGVWRHTWNAAPD